MTTHRNTMRELEFVVGYRLANAQRRFETDANVNKHALTNNPELHGIKAAVRKMKKV